MGLGKAVGVSEEDGKSESKKLRWGNCDTDVRNALILMYYLTL